MSELREQDIQVGTDDKFRARKGPLLGGEELMSWTIKALPNSTLPIDITMAMIGSFPFGMLLYGYLGEHDNDVDYHLKSMGYFGVCFVFLLWKGIGRQKNVYNYRFTYQGGEVEYLMDFPDMSTFFKWFTGICLFVVICMIAVEPSFFWMLAGPGGMAIMGARSLMSWENERKYNWVRWDVFDHVIIDRKRKVVVFLDDQVFFEAFLEKSQIDKYLEIVHLCMPPHTRFEEERWRN